LLRATTDFVPTERTTVGELMEQFPDGMQVLISYQAGASGCCFIEHSDTIAELGNRFGVPLGMLLRELRSALANREGPDRTEPRSVGAD